MGRQNRAGASDARGSTASTETRSVEAMHRAVAGSRSWCEPRRWMAGFGEGRNEGVTPGLSRTGDVKPILAKQRLGLTDGSLPSGDGPAFRIGVPVSAGNAAYGPVIVGIVGEP